MATAKKATTRVSADVVSAADLAKSIDGAITRAATQFNVPSGGPSLSLRWEIVGRIMKNMEPAQALDIAGQVAKAVNRLPGIDAQPTISRVKGGILVGFIERSQIPRSFGE
jgi:hypothetical protein